MTTIVGTLRKIEYKDDEVYYVQGNAGGLFKLTKKLEENPNIQHLIDMDDVKWSLLDWNYLASRKDERYKVNSVKF